MKQSLNLYITNPLIFVFCAIFLYGCASNIDQGNGINSGKEQNVPGWFWSNEIDANLKIRIKLPASYETDLTRSYPVVYLLDSDWYFYPSSRIGNKGISGLVEGMAATGQIPELILVGVCEINQWGTNMRGRDFHSERENFLAFLQNELITFINRNYRTVSTEENSNTLIGHSSGGHFAFYTLFSYRSDSATPFRNIISLSGSIEGEDFDYIYEHEEELFAALNPSYILNIDLFQGTGGSEEERFITGFYKMKDLLTSRNYKQFRFESRLFDGLNHGSIVYPGIEEGLRFIFNKDNQQ